MKRISIFSISFILIFSLLMTGSSFAASAESASDLYSLTDVSYDYPILPGTDAALAYWN